MKIFTVEKGKATAGVTVVSLNLKGAGVSIPAIIIGEEGRGRQRGVVPVELAPASKKIWQEKGQVVIFSARLTETRSGKPKLVEGPVSGTDAIIVSRTHAGYRGGNSHTGDKKFVSRFVATRTIYAEEKKGQHFRGQIARTLKCVTPFHGGPVNACDTFTEDEVQSLKERVKEDPKMLCDFTWDDTPVLTEADWDGLFEPVQAMETLPWPLKDIATGYVAQGDAGRMGGADQKISIARAGDIWHTSYGGRLYGAPDSHFHLYDGCEVQVMTKQERQTADLW